MDEDSLEALYVKRVTLMRIKNEQNERIDTHLELIENEIKEKEFGVRNGQVIAVYKNNKLRKAVVCFDECWVCGNYCLKVFLISKQGKPLKEKYFISADNEDRVISGDFGNAGKILSYERNETPEPLQDIPYTPMSEDDIFEIITQKRSES